MAKRSQNIFIPPCPSEGGLINEDICVGQDGRKISGIRKKVQESSGALFGPPPANAAPQMEEHVIKAEDDLRITMDAKGFYRAVSARKIDRVRQRHEELCRRYPQGYRRMCETAGGRIVTWQSEQDTVQPPESENPTIVERPPLFTLTDDDETPRVNIRTDK